MGVVTVTERTRQQGQRLKALRESLNLSKPLLCSRLGFGSTQSYDLYERGTSVIRIDRVVEWAEAFGMTAEDFTAHVINGREYDSAWTFRNALRGHIPEDLIDELAADWEGRPVLNQQAAVKGILQMAERQRTNATRGLDTRAM